MSQVVDIVNRGLVFHKTKLHVESGTSSGGQWRLATNRVPLPEELDIISAWAHKALPEGAPQPPVELPSAKSFMKFVAVPYPVTVESVEAKFTQSELLKPFSLASRPRIVRVSPAADTCTVFFDIWDVPSGKNAKQLDNRRIMFSDWTCWVRLAQKNPGVPQCPRCWRWGHVESNCPSQGNRCPKCSEPHREENHRGMASCCKAKPKAKPPQEATPEGQPCGHKSRCINCGNNHASNDRICQFWRRRFSPDWITRKYASMELARARARQPVPPNLQDAITATPRRRGPSVSQ